VWVPDAVKFGRAAAILSICLARLDLTGPEEEDSVPRACIALICRADQRFIPRDWILRIRRAKPGSGCLAAQPRFWLSVERDHEGFSGGREDERHPKGDEMSLRGHTQGRRSVQAESAESSGGVHSNEESMKRHVGVGEGSGQWPPLSVCV
jgi:hypothetical protein